MFVTAHRVRSMKGTEGINSFLHEHSDKDSAGVVWEPLDIATVAEQKVGKLILDSYDLPPGGNRVLSYLDAAAPDGTPVEAIAGLLDGLRTQLGIESDFPIVTPRRGSKAARFWVGPEHARNAADEYDMLASRILSLLRSPRRDENDSSGTPLDILFTFDDTGYHFELSPDSLTRVKEAHHSNRWKKTQVSVNPETMLEFESIHGDIYPHVATMVTGLRLEEVLRLGGVVFINKLTGKRTHQWPLE